MLKMDFRYLLLSVCLVSGNAFAAAIGMPEQAGRWGYSLGVAYATVDDPDAATRHDWALRPLNLVYTDTWRYDTRYWGELFYQESALDAAPGKIGQESRQLGARLSLQKSVLLSPAIVPWLGVGLQLSYDQFQKRHTVDSDGYLIGTYPDRDGLHATLLLNMVLERRISRDWGGALKLEQAVPLAEGVSELVISAVLLYRY